MWASNFEVDDGKRTGFFFVGRTDDAKQIKFGYLFGIQFQLNISEMHRLALSGFISKFTATIDGGSLTLHIIGTVAENWRSQCSPENKLSPSGAHDPLSCDMIVAQ
jgi:hypothetical protein